MKPQPLLLAKIVIGLLLGLNSAAFAQWEAQNSPQTNLPPAVRAKANRMPSLSVMRFSTLDSIQLAPKSADVQTLGLPTEGASDMQLQLSEANPLSPEFSVQLSSGTSYVHAMPSFYSGTVRGQKKSHVALMKTNRGWEGSIQTNTDHWTIGQIRQMKDAPHVLYKTSEETEIEPISCLGEVPMESPAVPKGKIMAPKAFTTCRSITIFLETDYFTYQAWGSNTAYVVNQLLATFHQVSQLYAQDGILLQLSGIKIWDTPDPWNGLTSAGEILSSVRAYYIALPETFPGTIHHFVSAKRLGGGVAYLFTGGPPVFGNMMQRAVFAYGTKSAAFGVSGNISDQIVSLPTYSWTVNVIAHEIGHNFGLPHTHSCSWPGGAIDNCGPTVGYDYENEPCNDPAPATPVTGGTIMSYCHLVPGVGMNFANGFGSLPSQKMLAEVNAAPGLSSGVAPPIASSQQSCVASSFTLVAAGCQGGTYRWYNQAVGGTLLATSASYTTPVLSASTTYFVDCTYEDCGTSPRRQVNITFGGVMPTPLALENLECSNEVGTLPFAVAGNCPNAQIQWFASAESTTLLGTGNSLANFPYRNSTTYFAQCAGQDGCSTSPRIPVKNTQVSNCAVCTLPFSDCSDNDVINRFTILTSTNQVVYDHSSGCSATGNRRDRISIPVLNGGQTYKLVIRKDNSVWAAGLRVWMGGQNDADWISLGHQEVGIWTADTLTFTIPPQFLSGQRYIRAHLQFNRLPTTPCQSTNFAGLQVFGEWEEVLVYVCPNQATYSVVPNPAATWVFQEALQSLEVSANLNTTRGKLTAGNFIEFKPGFEIQAGGLYVAQTNLGCPVNP